MPRAQCLRCGAAFRKPSQICRASWLQRRNNSTESAPYTNPSTTNDGTPKLDVANLLQTPTWSVRSLLSQPSTPSGSNPATHNAPSSTAETDGITAQKLHHLLRLSALPCPAPNSDEEKSMLDTLEQQLHFVRAIQAIETGGVEPLVAIRDETSEGVQEQTIGLQDPEIKQRLREEILVGRRRRLVWVKGGAVGAATLKGKIGVEEKRVGVDPEPECWDPLSTASRTVGRYFVVDSSVPKSTTAFMTGDVSVENTKNNESLMSNKTS